MAVPLSAGQITYAPAALTSSPPSGPSLLPEQYKLLVAQLKQMQEELSLCQDEIPRALFPTRIETPFLGTIKDTHTVGLPSHEQVHRLPESTRLLVGILVCGDSVPMSRLCAVRRDTDTNPAALKSHGFHGHISLHTLVLVCVCLVMPCRSGGERVLPALRDDGASAARPGSPDGHLHHCPHHCPLLQPHARRLGLPRRQ
jgi:hypothetical protein